MSLPEHEFYSQEWPDGDPRLAAWTHPSIVETQRKKWPQFKELVRAPGLLGIVHEAVPLSNNILLGHNEIMTFAYVLGKSYALFSPVQPWFSVLDWGGGSGHYAALASELYPEIPMVYTVRDLHSLCALGREMVPTARFVDDDKDLDPAYHVVLASGSLQYEEDWRGHLARMARRTLAFVYVTRLPVLKEAKTYVRVQRAAMHGYDVELLGWDLNRAEFLAGAEAAGLALLREFLTDEKPHVHRAPEQPELGGFLFRTKYA